MLTFTAFISPTQAASKKSKSTKSPTASASMARSKLSVTASFRNLTNVKSVAYKLTYDSNKGPQGTQGTIKVKPKTNSLSRKILFGTCSKNVCTYHRDIKNIKLSTDFTLKSGGVVSYEKNL